jgi:hypothetical protein
MFTLDDGLLMISEKCTYRMQVADQIDPERKNPNLPHNFQQKIFDHGTTSEWVCRTFLQAKRLFRKEFQSADVKRAMQLSYDALCDLVSMHEIAHAFKVAEQTAIEKAELTKQGPRSLTIPAVGNVRVQCKTYMQKADHFAGSLLSIIRLFYPEMKNRTWDDFLNMTHAKYGGDDLFHKVTELCLF